MTGQKAGRELIFSLSHVQLRRRGDTFHPHPSSVMSVTGRWLFFRRQAFSDLSYQR